MQLNVPGPVDSIIPYTFIYTATAGSDWMGASFDGIYCNSCEYTLPFAGKIVAFSYGTNTNSSTAIMEVHSASTTATSTTRQFSFTISSRRNCFASSFTHVSLNAGDRLMMYYLANGATPPNNIVATVYIQVTSLAQANTGYAHAGDTSRTASGGTGVTI